MRRTSRVWGLRDGVLPQVAWGGGVPVRLPDNPPWPDSVRKEEQWDLGELQKVPINSAQYMCLRLLGPQEGGDPPALEGSRTGETAFPRLPVSPKACAGTSEGLGTPGHHPQSLSLLYFP